MPQLVTNPSTPSVLTGVFLLNLSYTHTLSHDGPGSLHPAPQASKHATVPQLPNVELRIPRSPSQILFHPPSPYRLVLSLPVIAREYSHTYIEILFIICERPEIALPDSSSLSLSLSLSLCLQLRHSILLVHTHRRLASSYYVRRDGPTASGTDQTTSRSLPQIEVAT